MCVNAPVAGRIRGAAAHSPAQEETISDLLTTIERLNSLKQAAVFPVLKVGDSVERGPDWKWGSQDESPGGARCVAAAAVVLL